MGAINYYTSDYITLGVNCNNIESDDDYYFLQEDFEILDDFIKEKNFYYFHIVLKPGYYEGFSIDIEFNFGYCFDCWQDKKDAQKEITRIKQFLIDCVNDFGLCAVSPGWCTAYYDYNESLKRINKAIKEMRDTVRNTPTWAKMRLLEV